jgi:hypothetical protein
VTTHDHDPGLVGTGQVDAVGRARGVYDATESEVTERRRAERREVARNNRAGTPGTLLSD